MVLHGDWVHRAFSIKDNPLDLSDLTGDESELQFETNL